MAPGIPPLGPLPAVTTLTTYRELMTDATRDAVAANPRAYLLAGYRFVDPGGTAIPVPATLRDQTFLLCDRQPMVFLCLVPCPDGIPEVHILHSLLRYLELPGEHPRGSNNNCVLAFLGNVCPNQYLVVEVLNTTFHLTGMGMHLPTASRMDGLVAEWVVDDNNNMGPDLDADANTIVVHPSHVQHCWYIVTDFP